MTILSLNEAPSIFKQLLELETDKVVYEANTNTLYLQKHSVYDRF